MFLEFLNPWNSLVIMTESNDLLDHYLWSTKLVLGLLDNLTEEQITHKSIEINRSIKEIVLHLISIYAYFSSFNEYKSILESTKSMDKNQLLKQMRDLTKKSFIVFSNDSQKVIPIKTKKGISKSITGVSLFHMFSDHYAYHRGQIMTMYKLETGKDAVGTDYAVFLQEDNPDIDF